MEYYKEKYRNGVIDLKTYDKMMEVVAHLEQNGFRFVDNIGNGTYGSVLRVKHLQTGKELAAKVVEKKSASDGEINLWKTLKHNNILKLEDVQLAYYADSYIFFSPVYPKTLDQKVFDTSFVSDITALKQAKKWLKQIVNAVCCIHDKGFSHNDLKLNNILISDSGIAVVADFGFLTPADNLIQKYGTPFIYRCPEARLTESGMAPIDGKKLDIWTIGMLAFEMFTKMSLLVEMCKPNIPLSCWFSDVYPFLQKSLQKENFVKLMEAAFPNSKKVNETADNIIDFITTCLNVVPQKRPSVHQLRNHKLVGGTYKSVKSRNEMDVWKKRLNAREFNIILEKNKLIKIPETLDDEPYIDESNQVVSKADFIVSKQLMNNKEIENDQMEECVGNSIGEKYLDLTLNRNSHCSPKSSEKFEAVVLPDPIQTNKSAKSTNSSPLNMPDAQIDVNPDYDFDFDSLESRGVPVSPFIVSSQSTYNKKSRLIKWWKQRKFKVRRVFRAFFPMK